MIIFNDGTFLTL